MAKIRNKIARLARRKDLFRLCLTASFVLHLLFAGGYFISGMLQNSVAEDIEFEEITVDFEDIPPELIGGTTNPAPVEKQEWVEGKNKNGKDPEPEDDLNPDRLSGTGTDKDGYLYSFNGDKPPTAIVDFDLKQFFPQEAKSAGIATKTVVMMVQVDEQGKLISASIVSGRAGYGFDEAAMKIINRIRFSPGYVKGRPVKMSHRMPVIFSLED